MKLEIVHVPDCPNVAPLEQRLDEALAGSPTPVERSRRVVTDLESAAEAGMTGSPTLLVNGVDPFAEPDAMPSMSCRLYRGDDGWPLAVPSVATLRQVLTADQHGGQREASEATGDRGVADTDGSVGSALRDWRARAAPTDQAERAMHQLILRVFIATGSPPTSDEVDRVAAAFGMSVQEVLGRLHTTDVVRLGPDGGIRVAYPFSAVPTRHRVQLAGGVEVYAMCAIDALGIPPMLGADATFTTTDPVGGAPITVTALGGRFDWDPPTSVVFVGARSGRGPSAENCCDYLNVFTDRHQAETWIRAHPHVPGEVLPPADAALLGRKIFAGLLAEE